ncbi:LysM peptidoglycan-binding domain-containing protein [Caldovatus aquaticus]|uniref:LysM peptidoglycan-binding domain-containing protein n=1 Tax=Caldovatus aquaticus TaxID=2865671 RepID=A0ABS7EZE9_9PROT|nr:LysM peptidoglycan-binding domain-containing protein [Caldovatus aquaticus]MBW8268453.1 LysM peptidoglycan-binding domain-containing protein [Caldovatus aquaticus]
MPIYVFRSEGDDRPLPGAARIAAILARLGLSPAEVRAEPAETGTLRLSGEVPDAETHEKLLAALASLPGVARLDDRLTERRAPSLLDTFGAFARLPPGAAATDMAEEMVHEAAPGRRHADPILGPAGSALHVVQPGETLDDIARLHHGDATAALRILSANRPMLERAEALAPGMVLRVPPLPRG